MKKALLIAEKSSLMNDIRTTFQKHKDEFDFSITFVCQSGHLLTLLKPNEIDEEQKSWKWDNLPFHPKDYDGWKYKIIPGSESKFQKIKEELNSGIYDFIIHAGDPDQEGQLLVNLVLNFTGTNLPVKRFWTNSQAEKDILHALKNMEDNNNERLTNLYHAALARQHIDYLIGMNITEAASLKMNTMVVTGRCKTPACQIVCDREKEIENFVPKTDYELDCLYEEGFIGTLINVEDGKGKRFETKEELSKFAENLSDTAKIISLKKQRVKQSAPALYDMTTLQVEASQKYGYNSDKTLALTQKLYEKKYVSYPRTDCKVLSSNIDLRELLQSVSALPELEETANNITNDAIQNVYKNKTYINDAEMEEHGHYALSPTSNPVDITDITSEEKNILTMIYKRFLAIFLPPVVQDKTTIITENNGHQFKTLGKILIDKGYTNILEKEFKDAPLPEGLEEGQIVSVESYRPVEKTTTCPKRYTNGELIEVLEHPAKFLHDASYKSLNDKLRIGTSATRAAIIQQLVEQNHYLEYKKGKGKAEVIVPTSICRKIIDNFDNRDICKVDLSGQLEVNLQEIKKGNLDYKEVEREAEQFVYSMIEDIKHSPNIKPLSASKNIVCSCPKCDGDIIEGKKGYFCSNYKQGCESKLFKNILGATITSKDIEVLAGGGTIKKKLTKEKEDGTTVSWEQKLKLNMDDLSYEFVKEQDKESKLACPECSEHLKIGKYKAYCSCGFTIPSMCCDKSLSEAVLKELLLKGKTSQKVKGLVSQKKGTTFDAFLIYDRENGKIKLKFD